MAAMWCFRMKLKLLSSQTIEQNRSLLSSQHFGARWTVSNTTTCIEELWFHLNEKMHCFFAYFSKAKCQSWKWFSRDLACNHKGTYWFCCPAFKQKVVSMYVLVPLRRIQNDLNVHWRVSYWVSYHSWPNCFREPENNNLRSLCFCFEWRHETKA